MLKVKKKILCCYNVDDSTVLISLIKTKYSYLLLDDKKNKTVHNK